MASKLKFSSITTEKYNIIKDFLIEYSFINTKYGPCIIGVNKDQLCYTAFYDKGKENSAIDLMKVDWPNALLKEESKPLMHTLEGIFEPDGLNEEVNVLLKGTALQVAVWKELVNIKPGSTTSYEQVAKAVGKPTAIRAVANAIAKNRVAYFIPCHRVIQKSGGIGKYRWGVKIKEQMLNSEKV